MTGASSGIGRELARVAAREHGVPEQAVLFLVARSQEGLAPVAAELTAKGVEAAFLSIDLTDQRAGEEIERELTRRELYCDVLINSAGYGLFGPAAELDRDEQLHLFDVNARMLTNLCLRFLPGMIARRRGGILNVGSLTGYSPGPYMAVYYASKAYVRSFSMALANEVADTGVTVTCLCPGPVRSAFFERCDVGQTRLSKIMPRGNAPETAETGWRAFRAGKSVIVPRRIDRFISRLVLVMPSSLLTWLVGRLQRPRKRVDS